MYNACNHRSRYNPCTECMFMYLPSESIHCATVQAQVKISFTWDNQLLDSNLESHLSMLHPSSVQAVNQNTTYMYIYAYHSTISSVHFAIAMKHCSFLYNNLIFVHAFQMIIKLTKKTTELKKLFKTLNSDWILQYISQI